MVLLDETARAALRPDEQQKLTPIFVAADSDEPPPFDQWYRLETEDAPGRVDELTRDGYNAQLDIVYFANDVDCCGCPPHPALAGVIAANPWSANPWSAIPVEREPVVRESVVRESVERESVVGQRRVAEPGGDA